MPIELLRDLFEAETQHAREAWCVHRDIHLVGQALLERGGVTHVADFLRGKHRSFDTFMSCARVKVSPALASALAQHCRDTLADSATDDATKALAKHGLEFFGAQAPDGGGPLAAAPPAPHRWPPSTVTKDRIATSTWCCGIVAVVILLAWMVACMVGAGAFE